MAGSSVSTHAGAEGSLKTLVQPMGDIDRSVTVSDIQTGRQSNDSDVYRISLSIGGMTCGSCVGAVTDGLKDLPFVIDVNIDLLGARGQIRFEGKDNVDLISERVEELGFEASLVELTSETVATSQVLPTQRVVTIEVTGMFSESCPTNILNALREAFGDSIEIEQAPTLRDPKIQIRYEPVAPGFTVRQIVQIISDGHQGFLAKVWHPPSIEQRSRAIQHAEQRRVLSRLIFTFILAIPTLIIGVIYMSLVPSTNTTRTWFEEPVWAGNVSRFEWALFILTTPVMLFGADVFHVRAFKEVSSLWRAGSRVPILRRLYRFGSMNLLISAGTSVAYFSSVAVLIVDALASPQHGMNGHTSSYFDSVIFLSFFILIGKFLEAYSKAKTGDAVALLSKLRPEEAILVDSVHNGNPEKSLKQSEESIHTVEVDLLEIGDKVRVNHGTSPPTDGIISSPGSFLFDESSLTGESKPVKKSTGDQIFAGSVNVSQPLEMEVTSLGGTSLLDTIVSVVREGQAKRAPIERFADTVTSYFVPVITALAITTFLMWFCLGQSGMLPERYLQGARGGWAFWSLEFAIAVFVVACPCGLGLAAPTALFVGGGLAAKNGILVRGGGEAFQEASRLDAVVFDKTGTLTEGKMEVVGFDMLNDQTEKSHEPSSGRESELVLALAKVLEDSSNHPIAKAVAEYCAKHNDRKISISDPEVEEFPGLGMRGIITLCQGESRKKQKFEAGVGNERLFPSNRNEDEMVTSPNDSLILSLSRFQSLGYSTTIFYMRNLPPEDAPDEESSIRPIAVFAISDPIRPSAQSVLSALRNDDNLEIYMCTGDSPTTAMTVASQLGIPPTHIRAAALPMDKAAFIHELQQQPSQRGKSRPRIIAFVGDGTNDTPALSAADVSIALSSGTDIAISTASFILLNPDLSTILTLVGLSRRVFARVRWNFVWAAMYNVCLIPVAAGVLFKLGDLDGHGKGWRLGPVWAAAAMALSSLSVVVSSLALRLPEVRVRRWLRWAMRVCKFCVDWSYKQMGNLGREVRDTVDDEGRNGLLLSWA